jgi:hypothetical protein
MNLIEMDMGISKLIREERPWTPEVNQGIEPIYDLI